MTDANQTTADANTAAGDAPNLDTCQALKADAADVGDHLKQHAEILLTKIEDAKTLTDASHSWTTRSPP